MAVTDADLLATARSLVQGYLRRGYRLHAEDVAREALRAWCKRRLDRGERPTKAEVEAMWAALMGDGPQQATLPGFAS